MKLNLVLSGGGVKGAAHIGVLKVLEEQNIGIEGIAGTSSGSIVASLYGCGYSAKEIYYIFKKYCRCITDYDHMIPFKVMNTLFTGKIRLKSLARGNNIEYIIDNFCRRKGKINIKDIDMPIVIPAVDIRNGKIVYFNNRDSRNIENTTIYDDTPEYITNGKISEIVRASTAFPGVFSPKRINNHYLVDGGVRVNSPVSALKEISPNSKTLTVHFEKMNSNTLPKNLIETVTKSFDIMGHEINEREVVKSDYVIDIESKNVSLLDISKIDYMVSLGYRRGKELLDKIMY